MAAAKVNHHATSSTHPGVDAKYDQQTQALLQQQKAMDLYQEQMSLKSNLEKARHDLADTITRNIGS